MPEQPKRQRRQADDYTPFDGTGAPGGLWAGLGSGGWCPSRAAARTVCPLHRALLTLARGCSGGA